MELAYTQLAKKCGVHPHFLSAIERGNVDVGLSTLQRIADGFGVPLGSLFGPTAKLSSEARALARVFDRCPEPIQAGVLQILRAMQRR